MLVITITKLLHITITVVGNLGSHFWDLGNRVYSLKDKEHTLSSLPQIKEILTCFFKLSIGIGILL